MHQTFTSLLTAALRADAGRPFITYYDHATSERIELSVTTYANWVAKAAGLLVEEADVERGDVIRVDLPEHWMAHVFLGAAWSIGAAVTFTDTADVVICGPDSVAEWASAGVETVLATALAPLGGRFAEPLPPGVRDVGLEIWSQPDGFFPVELPEGDDLALADEPCSQKEMLQAATVGTLLGDGDRLLRVAVQASPPVPATLTEPLLRGGSLVLLQNPDADALERLVSDERITHRA